MIGKQIGNYKIVELIGKGGMAVVYRGQHLTLSRRIVAIKMLSTELERDPSFSERFFREAEVMDRLKHPNIVTLYDFIEEENHHFIVMEYVSGTTLNQIIKNANGPLPLKKVREIFGQVLDAIGYAHKLGIVHRDLKPSNIMIDREGQVKITDFGIARLLAENFEATLTTTGMGIGSPYYMSPEQVLASKDHPITAASDIYSLGITLYQMVTGKVPFSKKDSLFTILQAHVSTTPPPPREFCPGISDSLEEVILKAIEKKPEYRWATCEDFWKALDLAIREAEEGKTQVCGRPREEKPDVVPPTPDVSPVPAVPPVPQVPPSPDDAVGEGTGGVASGQITAAKPPKKRSVLKIVLSILIVVVIAGAGGYVYIQQRSKPANKVIPPAVKTVRKEIEKARNLLKQGELDRAIKLVNRILDEHPGDKSALKLQEDILNEKKKRDEEKLRKETLARLEKAKEFIRNGDLQRAREIAMDLLAMDPGNADAKAIVDLVRKKEKESLQKEIAEGYEYLKSGEFDKALKIADSVLQIYPDNPEALKLKSDTLLEKERTERGKQNDVQIKLVKAEAYLDAQNYTKAKLLAKKILELDPNNEKAQAILEEARAGEKRKFIDEKLSKGYTYLEAKAYKLALKEAGEILKAYPGEPRALKLKEEAQLLLEKQKREELARKRARIAQYLNEGKRFFKMGKYEQSILAFREVLRIDPNNREGKIWLRRAKKELDAIRKAWATGGGAYKIEKQDSKEE